MDITSLIEAYQADGFVVARGLFDGILLADVTAETERVVAAGVAADDDRRALFDDDPVCDGIQYIDKPPRATYEFPYHQDNGYHFYEPARALAATVALDAQPTESGPIACLRGSHRLAILPHRLSGVLGASRGLVDAPDTAKYPEVAVALEPGDVLVHHTNVIHRTGPNRTAAHRRNLGFTYHGAGVVEDVAARDRAVDQA